MPTSLENTIRGLKDRENLLEQVPVNQVIRPRGFYRKIVLDFLAVASSVWVSYACSNFLRNGAVLDFAISLFPFLVITSIETVAITSLGRRALVLIVETFGLLVFFYGSPLMYLEIAGGVFFVLSMIGEVMSRSEVMNSLEVSFLKFTAPVFKKTITALILFTIILYVPMWDYKDVFIPQNTFGGVFVWASGFLSNFYPELNFNSTISDLSLQITKYQLEGNSSYTNLPAAAQKSIVDQLVIENGKKLRDFFGSNVTGSMKISDALYNLILDSLNRWKAQFDIWFTISWVAVVFLASRAIGAIVWWLAAFVALVIYELLIGFNFLAIRGEPTTREIIAFP